jgi:flagellar basal body-associated protein FliL
MMKKIIYIVILIIITTFVIVSFSVMRLDVAAQSNKQGTQSSEHQGIPGPQENANPLAQAPITNVEVKPPNNATSAPPIEKGNMTGTSP